MERYHPVLITGANSGLGLAVAQSLLSAGRSVIVSVRDRKALGQVASAVDAAVTHEMVLDFAAQDVGRISLVIEKLPALSGVVHCAAMYSDPLSTASDAELRQWGLFYGNTLAFIKAVIGRMKAGGGGRCVLIGSVVGSPGRMGLDTPYSLYKGWLRLLAEAIAIEGQSFSVSGTYLNVGSFRKAGTRGIAEGRYLQISAVAQEVCRLVTLDTHIRAEQVDLLPLREMLPNP